MKKGDRKDLTGLRFGRLTVVSEHSNRGPGRYYWTCICDCGSTTVVEGSELKKGATKSCGCLKREQKPPVTKTHGLSKTKLYKIWVAMRQRCENPNDPNFDRYGGRGITVCGEWHRFEPFMEWALSNGYMEGKVDLDRKENDKGYSPSNCRFISHRENLRNTHRKLHDVIRGEDITLCDAAEKYGFPYACLYNRFKRGKRGDELIEPRRN